MRFSEREPRPGDVADLEAAEKLCFGDRWPARFFAAELTAPGRFSRILVGPAGELGAYLFCVWQYLDLHVLKVAVLPQFRRQGLARRLMSGAENHVVENGGETVTLEVRRSNEGAQDLYLAMGYQELGVRPGYYSDGEEAVIMTKYPHSAQSRYYGSRS